jgi:hypothetical protein
MGTLGFFNLMALPNIRRRTLLVGVQDFARVSFRFRFQDFISLRLHSSHSRQIPDVLVRFFAFEDSDFVTQIGVFIGV